MDSGRILVEGSPEALVAEHVSNDIVETDHTPDVVSCLDRLGPPTGFSDMVRVYTDKPREVALDSSRMQPGKSLPGGSRDVFLS
jgi:lipooligosaccharide transport system ATP-binding protein